MGGSRIIVTAARGRKAGHAARAARQAIQTSDKYVYRLDATDNDVASSRASCRGRCAAGAGGLPGDLTESDIFVDVFLDTDKYVPTPRIAERTGIVGFSNKTAASPSRTA
jgi:hypothetical protein